MDDFKTFLTAFYVSFALQGTNQVGLFFQISEQVKRYQDYNITGQTTITPASAPAFGGLAPAAAPAAATTTSSIFGGQQSNPAAASGGSIFGAPAPASGAFGAAPAPATTSMATASNPLQQTAPSIFGAPAQQAGQAQSIFGNPTPAATPATAPMAALAAPVGASPFASAAPTTAPVAGSDPFAKNTEGSTSVGMFGKKIPDQRDDFMYSKLEDLSLADLEAFKADEFVCGKIPEVPPPYELCFPQG